MKYFAIVLMMLMVGCAATVSESEGMQEAPCDDELESSPESVEKELAPEEPELLESEPALEEPELEEPALEEPALEEPELEEPALEEPEPTVEEPASVYPSDGSCAGGALYLDVEGPVMVAWAGRFWSLEIVEGGYSRYSMMEECDVEGAVMVICTGRCHPSDLCAVAPPSMCLLREVE